MFGGVVLLCMCTLHKIASLHKQATRVVNTQHNADPDTSFHFNADTDPSFFALMRIRIPFFTLIRIDQLPPRFHFEPPRLHCGARPSMSPF